MTRTLASLEKHFLHNRHCGQADGCTARQQQRHAKLSNKLGDACVTLNQIQVLGSHNSYHIQPRPALLAYLIGLINVFDELEYTHRPLGEQFESLGIRQIELDVSPDPDGGLFSVRHGLTAIMEDPVSHLPALDQPGFKVLHLQDIDFETTCLTFVQCLTDVKTWSDAHPNHLPIMIQVEAKEDDLTAFGFLPPVLFTGPLMDALDAEIRSVFPPEQMITPDDVRAGDDTLEHAILTRGWPTLAAARGKVLFTLDNGGHIKDLYLDGHPSLGGRILFTDSSPGAPESAFVKENDPIEGATRIPQEVRAGYVVRTRSDADTIQARSGDTSQRDAAIASGAQWVSTDYEEENPAFGTGYVVHIPGGVPARCNPLNGPRGCRAAALEHP